MLLSLELESDTPLYVQIRDQIIEGIATGALKDGESLPSTRQLALDFGINFHTVNKAYDMLRQEGIIRLHRKSGAIVSVSAASAEFVDAWTTRLRTMLAEAYVKGLPKTDISAHCANILASFSESEEGLH